MKTRQAGIADIKQNPQFSVLIVGAGVNGIGTFRDLALQGVDVLMVERGDFCSGASMASSHMLHGGIRYLENAEFRLVQEALAERNRLLRNAPHYAKPLPTTIPMYKLFSGVLNAPLKFLGLLDRPSERGALIIKLGLIMYDAYVRGDSPMPSHRFHTRKQALDKWPALNPEIRYTATYYDGAMPTPERLCIDMIDDTEAMEARAVALNYCSLVGIEDGKAVLRDEQTGEQITVQTQVLVNAAGPWIDIVNDRLSRQTTFIGGTKGSHLILDNPDLRQAIGDHEFFFENDDGRIVLIFPFGDKVQVGSTDIRIDNPDEAQCTEEEEQYILTMIPKIFPDIPVDASQIIYKFSGVRPLPSSGTGFTGQISRDHHIETVEAENRVPFPILSLVGGKWTSFRAFAEEVTDTVLDRLGRTRSASTADLPIGGGRNFPVRDEDQYRWAVTLAGETGLSVLRLRTLLTRYGTRAGDLARFLVAEEDRLLQSLPDYSCREVLYLVRTEKTVHLDDFLLRRSLIAWLGKVNSPLLEELAVIFGGEFGWSPEVCSTEIERAKAILAEKHGVRL
ncbi:MAG: glycerol-3-phosphate dehydrogenase/oxidase [Anaerolineales bacterium]|nr:glycerol-3-phosphate dehydrogenase/oxidase [Anaerolineales bacterium]